MSDMTWKTAIAEVRTDDVVVRGHRLSELVGTVTYTDMAFLLIRGQLPDAAERSMLEAVLVSLVDHGISPTAIVARTLTSCGTPIQASIAGAMLSIADWHGGSGEEVAQLLSGVVQEDGSDPHDRIVALVEARLAAHLQLPGFGHPQHREGDPRARQLLAIASDLGTAAACCAALRTLGEVLADTSGRDFLRQPNVTGAIAAILLDLGFPWSAMRGIVISARSLGLTAHVVEELEQGNKWRHASGEDVVYTGPAPADG